VDFDVEFGNEIKGVVVVVVVVVEP
jgi:hypothetical protein